MVDGIARSLRAARERRGWSRETLAHHAGMSCAAVAQIESGRRSDVRLRTLVRLAAALDVTLDELAGLPQRASPMSHAALLYAGADDFTTAAVAYLRDGVARDERPLAVTSPERVAAIRAGLGHDAGRVTFADWHDWYSSPTAALNGYRNYLNDGLAAGARRVRILGEPVWRGRSKAEVRAWTRYESLINIVFEGAPSVLLCPYDVRSTAADVVTAARLTHPLVRSGVTDETSTTYLDAEGFLLQP